MERKENSLGSHPGCVISTISNCEDSNKHVSIQSWSVDLRIHGGGTPTPSHRGPPDACGSPQYPQDS